MSEHDFTTCECRECHRALLDLQDELDELERTDPDVAAAAESYDRMVERITGRALPRRQPTTTRENHR